MLEAQKPKSPEIKRVTVEAGALILFSEKGMHRIIPMREDIVRISYTEREKFSATVKPGVIAIPNEVNWKYEENDRNVIFTTQRIEIVVNKSTGSFQYRRDGQSVLSEREQDSKELESFPSYVLDESYQAKTEKIQTADGEKIVVSEARRVQGETLYHTRLHLQWQEDEALFGLGQQEEGIFNLRGQTIYLHQANRKIAVPFLVSTKGYGILMDTYSPMIFHDDCNGSYLYSEADEELDFYFISAINPIEVIKGYRYLTGKAQLLPKWAFGYLQSQERYESQQEILDVAEGYRDRKIGLDGIVLDWCSWEDGMWGQKTVDKGRFPDMKAMIEELHKKNVHFMISIWPNMDPKTENYKQLKEAGELLPACNIYNALSEKGREIYWKQVKEGLYQYGIDAWWCDSSEPLTVEWEHSQRMEPATMYAEYCRRLQDHIPAKYTNAYCLFHAKTLYEGQRLEGKEKRVCNLTRSAYTGQQRYGTILWSGDISASWDTYRKQITNGLNFSASGLPYWTVDIGAFFVKRGNVWYWDGEYEDTVRDAGYLELFTRWYQWGAMLPVFRGHGTDCRRELWEFAGADGMFYEAILKANRLRYQLLPYIYSQAGKVWLKDESMMMMLPLVFPKDRACYRVKDEYMFGDSILVCPVTEPMYYTAGNKKIENSACIRRVYLPKSCGWYDFWTNQHYDGGQWIDVQVTLDTFPVFMKEGSVIPMAQGLQSVNDSSEIIWCVYAGKDCDYEYYEDSGDGYAYEEGEYSLMNYHWSESDRKLTDSQGNEVCYKVIIF